MVRVRGALTLIVGVLALLMIGWAVVHPGAPKAAKTVTVGRLAPPLSLPDLNGRMVSLASLRGHPLYLNFWNTWCPPCRGELPALERLHKTQGKRLLIVGVNLTVAEKSPAVVRAFALSHHLTYTILLDQKGVSTGAYLLKYIPVSVFVDAQGVVRQMVTGEMTYAQMKQAVASIGG